jgi:hypothetical protein
VAGERGFRASSDAGSATFSFVGGRLRACAFSLALGAGFELWPCSTFEGGAVVAKGYIDNPNTQVDPWFAVGAAIRFGYRAAVGGLHLEVGPVFPILKTHYVFGPVDAPDGTVHDTPAVGLQAALGGSLTIF